MKLTRYLCAVFLILIALPLLAVGWFIVMEGEAKPMHVLDVQELARVEMAGQFVDHHFAQYRRVPTAGEFQVWADHAPSDLRLDGVGFTYSSLRDPSERAYAFSFWEGDAWVTWRSTFPDNGVAEVSPADAFVAGSKWADVLVFFGTGVTALLIAVVLSCQSAGRVSANLERGCCESGRPSGDRAAASFGAVRLEESE